MIHISIIIIKIQNEWVKKMASIPIVKPIELCKEAVAITFRVNESE